MKALLKILLYTLPTLFLFAHCVNKENRGKSFVFTSDTIFINKDWDIDNLVFGKSTIADFEIFAAARPMQFSKFNPSSGYYYNDKMRNPVTKQKKYTNVYFSNIGIRNDSLRLGFDFSLIWAGDLDIERDDIERNATLQSVRFNNNDKLKFYNGITFKSTKEDVMKAFGEPDKQNYGELDYTFNDIKVKFRFYDDTLLNAVYIDKDKQTEPIWIFKENTASRSKESEQAFVFKKDTIFINRDWDIDNLKFGKSTDADFEIFRKKRQIFFKEFSNEGHSDGDKFCHKYSYIDFKSSGLLDSDLKFVFSKEWECCDTIVPAEHLLDEAYFYKCKKIKFYNGITIKSTKEDVTKAFDKLAKDKTWNEDYQTLYYTFDNDIFVYFSFDNGSLESFNIQKNIEWVTVN